MVQFQNNPSLMELSYRNFGLGALTDYDIITVGGQQYSVNQVVDKTVFARIDTPVYQGVWSKPAYIVKAGQAIGKVYSYLKPSANTGGRSGLMFYDSNDRAYFTLDEIAIDTNTLKDQGAKTIAQEFKEQQEKERKENDPFGYCFKKYGVPALLIIGGCIVAATVGKEAVKGLFTSKTKAAAEEIPAT